MKKHIIALSVGMFIGAVAAFVPTYCFFWLHLRSNDWKTSEALHLLEKAKTANFIRSGHLEEYYKNTESGFLKSVPRINQYSMQTQWGRPALWAVQEYYRDNKIEAPSEIQPILDSLLPRIKGNSQRLAAQKPVYPADAAKSAVNSACIQARTESKLVFLKSGFPECGWCRVFDRYHEMPDVQAILNKYYVIAKIDIKYMPDGLPVFRAFAEPGSPSWAIITPDRKVVTTSFGSSGNVGYPFKPEETAYYLKALKTATPSISQAELDQLSLLIKRAAKR